MVSVTFDSDETTQIFLEKLHLTFVSYQDFMLSEINPKYHQLLKLILKQFPKIFSKPNDRTTVKLLRQSMQKLHTLLRNNQHSFNETEDTLFIQLTKDQRLLRWYKAYLTVDKASDLDRGELALFIHAQKLHHLFQDPIRQFMMNSNSMVINIVDYINQHKQTYQELFSFANLDPASSEFTQESIQKIFNIQHPLTDLDIFKIHAGLYTTNHVQRSAQRNFTDILSYSKITNPNLDLITFLFSGNLEGAMDQTFSQLDSFRQEPEKTSIAPFVELTTLRFSTINSLLAEVQSRYPSIEFDENTIQNELELTDIVIQDLKQSLLSFFPARKESRISVPKPPHQDEITIQVSGVYHRTSLEKYLNLEGHTTSWKETASTATKPFTEASKKPDPLDMTKNIYTIKAKQQLKKTTVIEYSERLNEYSLTDASVKTLREILIPMLRHAHQKSVNISEIENKKIQKIIYREMHKAKIEVVGLHLSEKEQQKLARKPILDTTLTR